ncbi:hypothetical protein AOT99_gpU6 [Vespertilionid gammaherpesvirus 1]|uniref:Uncharacterized protein n=1 Tax=Vespertilionid gammaherpesvirus 1 TaxID=2560830 RepID=A0A109Q951_9GAMA|nr:hypothetical protein AOT99_gpU6 [Myotis gammaherpesvirus 8]AMA67360.1 hypothetical protein AOT99_gpU6 [Vespertilionid gammaherpesvirus 1]
MAQLIPYLLSVLGFFSLGNLHEDPLLTKDDSSAIETVVSKLQDASLSYKPEKPEINISPTWTLFRSHELPESDSETTRHKPNRLLSMKNNLNHETYSSKPYLRYRSTMKMLMSAEDRNSRPKSTEKSHEVKKTSEYIKPYIKYIPTLPMWTPVEGIMEKNVGGNWKLKRDSGSTLKPGVSRGHAHLLGNPRENKNLEDSRSNNHQKVSVMDTVHSEPKENEHDETVRENSTTYTRGHNMSEFTSNSKLSNGTVKISLNELIDRFGYGIFSVGDTAIKSKFKINGGVTVVGKQVSKIPENSHSLDAPVAEAFKSSKDDHKKPERRPIAISWNLLMPRDYP